MFNCWPVSSVSRSIELNNCDVISNEITKKIFKRNIIINQDGSKHSFCYMFCDSYGSIQNTENESPILQLFPNCTILSTQNDQIHSLYFTIYAKGISNQAIYVLIKTERTLNSKIVHNWNQFVINKLKQIRNKYGFIESIYWYRAYCDILYIKSISWYDLISNRL
jgi:hypothetical protein